MKKGKKEGKKSPEWPEGTKPRYEASDTEVDGKPCRQGLYKTMVGVPKLDLAGSPAKGEANFERDERWTVQ